MKEEATREHSLKGSGNSEVCWIFSFVMCSPARPYGTTPLLLDAFSWNFIFGCFTKIFFNENQYSLKSDKT